jgi:serine carboxypeptidase-like clade I
MWSGYVDIGNGKHIFYLYTESLTPTEQVVLWSNGGPGASSLIGAFTELGVFQLDGRSLVNVSAGQPPNLILNENTWANHANLLYFDHPAGVGLSYCDNAAACEHTDESTAVDLYNSIDQFFTVKFPELQGRPFFMTGESYAGMYLPMTALVALSRNNSAVVNLQGMAIGDGCIGLDVGTCSNHGPQILSEFLLGQSFISQQLFLEIQSQCVNWDNPSNECLELLLEMTGQSGNYFIYMVDDLCPSDHVVGRRASQGVIRSIKGALARDPESGGVRLRDFLTKFRAEHQYFPDGRRMWSSDVRTSHEVPRVLEMAQEKKHQYRDLTIPDKSYQLLAGTNVWYCDADTAMGDWLNDPSVLSAMHANQNPPQFPFVYNRTKASLLPDYPTLASNYRMLIYSGNADACIPTPGSEQWTAGLGFDVVEGWRPWVATQNDFVQQAGYATVYAPNNFTFLTLTLSGHMAPQFVGPAALAMFDRFINFKPY